MDVVSHCALPVSGRIWKPRPGAAILTFVCKATFVLAPGELALAEEQQPLHEVDCPWSDEVQSLYAASDLAPRKLRADVVLIGAAYAPGGVPVSKLTARLTVGAMSKAVDVWCDRTLRPDGGVVEGASFTHLPLLYERAAGGEGTDNPVGMSQQPDAYGAVALPNLTVPGARVGLDVALASTGFGPVGAQWPSRLALLGRHADAVSSASWHEQPLPPDLDMGYFNVAPPDQQTALLKGGERLILENLHPEHPRLDATLPRIHPRAQVTGPGGDRSAAMRCDTLWIDTSRGLCTLTYRGQVVLGSRSETGLLVVTLDDDEAEAAASARTSHVPDVLSGTLSIEGPAASVPRKRPPAATLPFLVSERPDGARDAQALGGLPFRSSDSVSSLFSAPLPLPPPPSPSDHEGAPLDRAPPDTGRALPPVHNGAALDGGRAPLHTLPLSPPSAEVPSSTPVNDGPWTFPVGGPSGGALLPVPFQHGLDGLEPGDFRGGGGALIASNAAAGVVVARPATASTPALVPSPAPLREPPDAVDLVYFDGESVPRLRRVPAWRRLLARLDERPLDAEEDDPAAAKDPKATEDQREILEILSLAEPATATAVDGAMSRARREDGRFFAPVVLVTGELSTPFAEVETLQSTVNTVTPLIGGDETLRASVEIAKELLALPALASAPAVTAALTGRVRDAFNAGKRSLPAGYLDAQTERSLLEQRAYQRRTVLGGRRQRALFHFAPPPPGAESESTAPVVTYLPDAVAPKLPLFARFKVRMIVRVHHALDQYEPGPLALEVLAVARLIAPRRPS